MHILLALLASLALLVPGTGVVATGMIDRDDAADAYDYDLDDRFDLEWNDRGGDFDEFFDLDLANRNGSDIDLEDVWEHNFRNRGNQQNQNAQDQNAQGQNNNQTTQPDQNNQDSQNGQQNQNGTDAQQNQQNQNTPPAQPNQQSSGASYTI